MCCLVLLTSLAEARPWRTFRPKHYKISLRLPFGMKPRLTRWGPLWGYSATKHGIRFVLLLTRTKIKPHGEPRGLKTIAMWVYGRDSPTRWKTAKRHCTGQNGFLRFEQMFLPSMTLGANAVYAQHPNGEYHYFIVLDGSFSSMLGLKPKDFCKFIKNIRPVISKKTKRLRPKCKARLLCN
jgi:hypothetical protein